jgi:hypothetical protein
MELGFGWPKMGERILFLPLMTDDSAAILMRAVIG